MKILVQIYFDCCNISWPATLRNLYVWCWVKSYGVTTWWKIVNLDKCDLTWMDIWIWSIKFTLKHSKSPSTCKISSCIFYAGCFRHWIKGKFRICHNTPWCSLRITMIRLLDTSLSRLEIIKTIVLVYTIISKGVFECKCTLFCISWYSCWLSSTWGMNNLSIFAGKQKKE